MALRVTANFKRNLDEIESFLSDSDASGRFDRFLDDLFGAVFPLLEEFPQSGADFFRNKPLSLEVARRIAQLQKKYGADLCLRELIHDDYLLLYALREDDLYLLSIKHHRQLSFDLRDNWF